MQRARQWCCCAPILPCYHVHVIMFPRINIKCAKSTWNQHAWHLEACSHCVCKGHVQKRTSKLCVIIMLHWKKKQQLLKKYLRQRHCWFTTSPNIWMLGSWPMPSDTAKPWRTHQPKDCAQAWTGRKRIQEQPAPNSNQQLSKTPLKYGCTPKRDSKGDEGCVWKWGMYPQNGYNCSISLELSYVLFFGKTCTSSHTGQIITCMHMYKSLPLKPKTSRVAPAKARETHIAWCQYSARPMSTSLPLT